MPEDRMRWTPVGPAGQHQTPGKWLMRCSCGTERYVLYKNYAQGKSLSCGCYRLELARNTRGNNRLPPGESARNQLLLIYKRGAAKKGRVFELSREQFLQLTSSNCHYCGHPPHQILNRSKYTGKGNGAYIYNGIDRKDSAVGYTQENSLPCCRMCNYAKSDMCYDDYIRWMEHLIEFRTTGWHDA